MEIFGITILTILLFLFLFTVLGLLAVSVLALRRFKTAQRSYFYGAIASLLIALVFVSLGVIFGLGDQSSRAPYNFMPIIIMSMLFFVPAAVLSLLIGWWEMVSPYKPVAASTEIIGKDADGHTIVRRHTDHTA